MYAKFFFNMVASTWLWSKRCTSKTRLDGKTAIITGANVGLGKYTALDFCRRGCRVIMACRDIEKAKEAKKNIQEQLRDVPNTGVLVIKKLDLSSLASVRQCAQEILEEEEQINILVNNAGVCRCPKMLTKDNFEMQIGTNHLGHFLFTLLLLPRILPSAPARIINVSSSAHSYVKMHLENLNWEHGPYSPPAAYSASKLANILFTVELARRLKGTGVTAYAVHPGIVFTNIIRHLDSTVMPGTLWLFQNFLRWFMKTPEQGAQTIIHCAVDEEAGNESGQYYVECEVTEPSPQAKDEAVAEQLWDRSIQLVQLNDFDLSRYVK